MTSRASKARAGPLPSSRQPPLRNPQHFFDLVVGNAVDFFKTSLKEFKARPKYSVINFCSGLELILKARLLNEHWALIVRRPEDASLPQFQNGDFVSVTIDETINRLNNIATKMFLEMRSSVSGDFAIIGTKSFISATARIPENLMTNYWKRLRLSNVRRGVICIED